MAGARSRASCSGTASARNAALVEVAKIVHAADVSADIDTVPEGRGLKAIAHGFSLLFGRDDQKKIELESPMYDALYAWCQHRLEGPQRIMRGHHVTGSGVVGFVV